MVITVLLINCPLAGQLGGLINWPQRVSCPAVCRKSVRRGTEGKMVVLLAAGCQYDMHSALEILSIEYKDTDKTDRQAETYPAF